MLVDLVRFELTTSSMPWKRAPNCATGPRGCTTGTTCLSVYRSVREQLQGGDGGPTFLIVCAVDARVQRLTHFHQQRVRSERLVQEGPVYILSRRVHGVI